MKIKEFIVPKKSEDTTSSGTIYSIESEPETQDIVPQDHVPQRKKVQEARQQLNLAVSPEQKTKREKTLNLESAVLEELESRMREARTSGKQAEGVLKETRREQARFGFQPFR